MQAQPEGSPESYSPEDWEAIQTGIKEIPFQAARIARFTAPTNPEKPNIRIGLRAVLNGLSFKDAKIIGNGENVDHFLDFLVSLRKDCILRLRDIEQPTRDDVELVFVSARLQIAQLLAAPLRGKAIKRLFDEHLSKILSKTLHFLNAKLGDKTSQASSEELDKAFAATLDDLWKEKHRIRRIGIFFWQGAAMICLATHGLLFEWNPIAGACVLVAGLLLNIFLFWSIGTGA